VLSATWAGPDPYFRRLFESRKGVLQTQGVEAYLRASALYMSPPAWISANDALLNEQHEAALAEASPVEVTVSRIDAIVRHDRRARLGEIRVPALVIVAQDDMITPRFYSDELASRVPGAKLVVLDGGGHAAPTTCPAAYNAAVGAFLRAQRRG
jgi:aminoacrylate hydrolase